MDINDEIFKDLIQSIRSLNLKLVTISENIDLKNLDELHKQRLAIALTHANVLTTNINKISQMTFGKEMDNDELFKFLNIDTKPPK